jgi:hypothetical protein
MSLFKETYLIFKDISKEGMIPVLPEMQQYFDLNQIASMPQKEFSSDIQYGNEPKIMDSGLLNQNFGMKKQLPLISDPALASIAGINQFGNPMGNLMGNPMGNPMANGLANGLSHLGSAGMGEFGKEENNLSLQTNTFPVTGSTNNLNVLSGGEKKKKNFFLKKN